MKKYITPTLLIVVILMFGLFVFAYKPSTQDQYDTPVDDISSKEKITSKERNEENSHSQDFGEGVETSEKISILNEEAITVEKGDSFIGILTKKGLDYDEATSIYQAYKKVYDARTVKVGQVLNISSVVDPQTNTTEIIEIVTEPEKGKKYILQNMDVIEDDLKEEVKMVTGTINGTVIGSMKLAGVPQNIAGNFVNIFSYSVDFRKDVAIGDKFKVAYAVKLATDEKIVYTGDIIYAELTLGKTKTALYRFKDSSGTIDYYDEKGFSFKSYNENLSSEKLKEFSEIVSEIKAFINENKPIQNQEIYSFTNKYAKYKAYVEKDKNIEISESLQKNLKGRLPRNIAQAIDSMEIKIDNDKMYSATVYIKHGYEYNYKNIAYQIVQEILNILMAEGRSPFHEHMSVFAHVSQKVKGVTGQNMVNPFGNAFYDYTNDTIQWKDWKRGLFF